MSAPTFTPVRKLDPLGLEDVDAPLHHALSSLKSATP
jgi:hypothetical protein